MATIDNALTTLARAKNYIGITGTTKDAKLTKLIIGVSKFVESYCRRSFKNTVYTNQILNGNGSQVMFLNGPISTTPALVLEYRTDVNNTNSWETISSELYFIDYSLGKLTMKGGFWEGTQNYRVTYTAGYTLPSSNDYQDGTDDQLDLPADLEMAVLDLIQMQMNSGQSKGVSSERVRDINITYLKSLKDDPMIKQTLDSYKRMIYR